MSRVGLGARPTCQARQSRQSRQSIKPLVSTPPVNVSLPNQPNPTGCLSSPPSIDNAGWVAAVHRKLRGSSKIFPAFGIPQVPLAPLHLSLPLPPRLASVVVMALDASACEPWPTHRHLRRLVHSCADHPERLCFARRTPSHPHCNRKSARGSSTRASASNLGKDRLWTCRSTNLALLLATRSSPGEDLISCFVAVPSSRHHHGVTVTLRGTLPPARLLHNLAPRLRADVGTCCPPG